MKRDEARSYFSNIGLTYADITRDSIDVLCDNIIKQLKTHEKTMPMRLSKKIKINYNPNGTLEHCFLFVNGGYFTRREAISFDKSGFIGFAGWACDINAVPLTIAFKEWVDWLTEGHQSTESA